jgi:hypothetical protein
MHLNGLQQRSRRQKKHNLTGGLWLSKILHGGRLGSMREDVAKFTSSIKDDARLLDSVIAINKAHVVMLAEQKIITPTDAQALLSALNGLDGMQLDATMEDAHMAVEEAVLKVAGSEAGGNLHIAKKPKRPSCHSHPHATTQRTLNPHAFPCSRTGASG